jgi:hypothetical protein
MKNFLSLFSKLFSKGQLKAGMTLTDMLLTGLLGVVVIGAAGSGLASIMNSQKTVSNEIDTRVQVNRALDFMTLEARQARSIEVAGDGTGGTVRLDSVAPIFDTMTSSIPGYQYPVLLLQLPGVSQRVVYYLETPSANSWRSPRVVYRWGPSFDANGNYTNPNSPESWISEPLIDLIDDTATTPNCPTGWGSSPSDATPVGFSACVKDDGKVAQISLNGKINKTIGSSEIYQGDKTILALASDIPEVGDKPIEVVSNPVAECEVGEDGILRCIKPVTLTLKVIGDAFSCGRTNPATVTTAFKIDGSYVQENGSPKNFRGNDGRYADTYEFQADSTTEVIVESTIASSCASRTRMSNAPEDKDFIYALVNGQKPPNVSGWDGQDSAKEFLRDYLDANGNISIGNNQIIYLFEMYHLKPNPGEQPPGSYDLQDNVVLVTFESPHS